MVARIIIAAVAGIVVGAAGYALFASSAPSDLGAPADPDVCAVRDASTLGPRDCRCPACAPPEPCPPPASSEPRPDAAANPPSRANPADHALRWPEHVPANMQPEFVRDVVKRARADCGEALPPHMYVDCKGFPCVIVTRTEHRADWSSLRDLCETFAELGELSTSTFYGSKGAAGVRLTRQSVPDEYRLYEQRSAPLRRKLSRSGDVERLDCEHEGNADACATWATKLAADDLDAALGLSQVACEDGSGQGCAVLAQLGIEPRANYRQACQLGSADGCRGMVHELCGQDGETCDSEALSFARQLHQALETNGAYHWKKQEALGVVGSVLCATGDKEAGLEALIASCLDPQGNPRSWCDPEKRCNAPRFAPPNLW